MKYVIKERDKRSLKHKKKKRKCKRINKQFVL